MEYVKHDLTFGDPTKWIDLHFISDVHKGAGGHNDKAFTERIESIRTNPRAVWFGVGDLGDYIFYSDPRFSMSAIADIDVSEMRDGIFGQIRKIATALEPIKDKCVGVGSGNHEEKIYQRYHVDPTRELSYRLKVPYIGYSALTLLRLPGAHDKRLSTYSARIYTHHGYGGGRRHGPQINKVEDCLRLIDGCDIFALAHVHGKVASKLILKGINSGGNPTESLKTFIVTGSYQDNAPRGTITYAERMAFPKSPYGSPTVRIRWTGKKHRLETQVVL